MFYYVLLIGQALDNYLKLIFHDNYTLGLFIYMPEYYHWPLRVQRARMQHTQKYKIIINSSSVSKLFLLLKMQRTCLKQATIYRPVICFFFWKKSTALYIVNTVNIDQSSQVLKVKSFLLLKFELLGLICTYSTGKLSLLYRNSA